MLLPTINPFYMQSTIWKVIIPNQNKQQCSAAFKSALHQVNDNQKKTGEYKTYITCVTQMFRQFKQCSENNRGQVERSALESSLDHGIIFFGKTLITLTFPLSLSTQEYK